MKKEIVVAVVFGVILGLGVALIMILRLRQANVKNTQRIPSEAQISTTIKPEKSLKLLEITQPTDGTAFNKNSVTIKGKASKDTLIVIQSPIKELIFENKKGDFSVDFPLSLGENVISIVASPKSSQLSPQHKTLRVYYLDEL